MDMRDGIDVTKIELKFVQMCINEVLDPNFEITSSLKDPPLLHIILLLQIKLVVILFLMQVMLLFIKEHIEHACIENNIKIIYRK